jgi:hypothetical protein
MLQVRKTKILGSIISLKYHFPARVNPKLKKIVCKITTDDLNEIYERLKTDEANNVEFNKGIEFVVDPKLIWKLQYENLDFDDDYVEDYYFKYGNGEEGDDD